MTVANNALRAAFIHADLERVLPCVDLAPLRGMRIFVTGGTGFVGFWLLSAIRQLNEQGYGIRVVALSRRPEAFLRRHPEFGACAWLTFIQGDIKTYDTHQGKFDAFIHGAAAVRPEAAREPYNVIEDLLAGSLRVMHHARLAKTRRLLLVSSGASYGQLPLHLSRYHEDLPGVAELSSPGDAYGAGKRGMETLGACLGAQSDIDVITARLFAFIGPWLPSHLVISQLMADTLGGKEIVLKSDGTPVRSYLYAADLAVWLLALLAFGHPSRAYNVGSDQGMSLATIAQTLRDSLAPGKRVSTLAADPGGPRNCYVPDISRARGELGLGVWTEFVQAARRTAEWASLADERGTVKDSILENV